MQLLNKTDHSWEFFCKNKKIIGFGQTDLLSRDISYKFAAEVSTIEKFGLAIVGDSIPLSKVKEKWDQSKKNME